MSEWTPANVFWLIAGLMFVYALFNSNKDD